MMNRKEQRTANNTFAIGVVSYSADSLVVTCGSVLPMNPESFRDAKKTAHRKSANVSHAMATIPLL